mgnify:FL=1|jgi:hypothetical protein
MDISPRAKLDEEKRLHVLLVLASRKARCATVAFKVRFCLLAQHEEAVLEDEEAKHIERMMMRCHDGYNGEKVVIFERETNKKKETMKR